MNVSHTQLQIVSMLHTRTQLQSLRRFESSSAKSVILKADVAILQGLMTLLPTKSQAKEDNTRAEEKAIITSSSCA